MGNIPKSFIHLLIQCGTPIIKGEYWEHEDDYAEINYYGSCLNTSYEIAIDAHTDLSLHGIDYEACKNYADDSGYTFEGTFTECGTLSFLRCDIVTNNGEIYRFAVKSNILNLGAFICRISDNPPSFQDALDGLDEKINKYKNEYFGKDYYKHQDFTIQ